VSGNLTVFVMPIPRNLSATICTVSLTSSSTFTLRNGKPVFVFQIFATN